MPALTDLVDQFRAAHDTYTALILGDPPNAQLLLNQINESLQERERIQANIDAELIRLWVHP